MTDNQSSLVWLSEIAAVRQRQLSRVEHLLPDAASPDSYDDRLIAWQEVQYRAAVQREWNAFLAGILLAAQDVARKGGS